MSVPIEGKIAKILDEYNVAINVGRKHGVTEGMPFVIYAQGDEEVRDPDTGELLGRLEMVKGYISIALAQENMSLCRPSAPGGLGIAESAPGGLGAETLSGAMMAESLRYRAEKESRLNVNPSQVSGMLHVGAVSVGDRVRSIEKK